MPLRSYREAEGIFIGIFRRWVVRYRRSSDDKYPVWVACGFKSEDQANWLIEKLEAQRPRRARE